MNRMKLKKRKKLKKINIVLLVFFLIIVSVIYILAIFSEKALPIFLEYSEVEVKRIASLLINNSVISEIGSNTTFDDLFIVKEDNNGNIISLDINSAEVTKILIKSNEILEKNFKYLENGDIDKLEGININSKKKGVIYEMPSGIIFKNIFLNNLLPKIPVRLNLVSSIFSKLTTEVESYGINNGIFKVNVQVTVNLKVILPFVSKNLELVAVIPIIIKIIEGDVPYYYFEQ